MTGFYLTASDTWMHVSGEVGRLKVKIRDILRVFGWFSFMESFLTHISLASFLWDICKQCRPRPDTAERGVLSGSLLFAHRMFYQHLNKHEKYQRTPLNMEMDWSN